jgi:tRNA(Ile)-lysidine synthase
LLDFIDKQSGSMLDMPYGMKVYKEYDYLVFVRDCEIKEKSIKPFIKTDFDFNDIKIEIKKVSQDDFSKEKFVKDTITFKNGKIDDNKFLFFDGEKIPNGAVIRYREEKDRFTPYNGKNKLLSDYMTDKKIPYRLRDKIAIVADGNEVLMILGYEISDKIKVIEDSKEIFKITTINTCC